MSMSGVNKERKAPAVESYDLNDPEYYVKSLPPSTSSLLVNLSDGFGPEENLKSPFKGFTPGEEERFYTRLERNDVTLFEKVQVLTACQKESVLSVVKSQNGVVPIRKDNFKATLHFKRLAETEGLSASTFQFQPPPEMEAGGEGYCGAAGEVIKPKEEFKETIPPAVPIKMKEQKIIEKGLDRPQHEKRNSKRSQLDAVMAPVKHPKRVENSLEKSLDQTGDKDVNDYEIKNGKKGLKGGASGSPHSSFMRVTPVSVSQQSEGMVAIKDIAIGMSHPGRKATLEKEGAAGAPIQKGNLQCSLRCEGRGGKVPNLECNKCRCLVHPECAGIPDLISSTNFICPNCHQLYLERKKAEAALYRRERMSLSPPIPISSYLPRRGAPDRNMMLISLLNVRSQPIKRRSKLPKVPRSTLNILSPPKPSWMIRGPSTSLPSPSEMAWGTVVSSPGFAQFRPPAPPNQGGFVYKSSSDRRTAPPPSSTSFIAPVKIAPRPDQTTLDYMNATGGQLTFSLVRCPPSLKLIGPSGGGESGLSGSKSSSPSPSPFKIPVGRPPLAVNKIVRARGRQLRSSTSLAFSPSNEIGGGLTITRVSSPPQQRIPRSIYNRLQERFQQITMPQPLKTPVTKPSTVGQVNTPEKLGNEEEREVYVIRMPRSGVTVKVVKQKNIIDEVGNGKESPITASSSSEGHGNPAP